MKPRGASIGLQEAWQADHHDVAIGNILDRNLDLPLLAAHTYTPTTVVGWLVGRFFRVPSATDPSGEREASATPDPFM